MVLTVKSPSSSCEAMMQEIAESSVESILTGMDTPEYHSFNVRPDTPVVYGVASTPTACDYSFSTEWLASPTVAYGGMNLTSTPPAWSNSFCLESSEMSSHYRGVNRQLSCGKSFDDDNMSYNMCGSHVNRSDSGFSTATNSSTVPPGITTVMLRNIPNKYTRSGLLSALVDKGFDPTIDCNNLYLPMDASSGCNLGYAFLNFTSHAKALEFMQQFDGVRLPSAGSRKVCSVVWANKQGLFQHSNPPIVGEEFTDIKQSSSVDGDGLLPMTPAHTMIPSSDPTMTPTCKIFVGGLPNNTTEKDLIEYFQKFGPIKEASIVANRQTGQSRGFGFCEFFSPDSVDRVQLAQAKRPHSINCRVVSVRPYNFNQLLVANSMDDEEPEHMGGRFTFFMGQGGIHECPQQIDSFTSY